jgi:hypothetical protein
VEWLHKSLASLQEVFPTPQEAIQLKNAQRPSAPPSGANVKWAGITGDIKAKLSVLDALIKSVDKYSVEMTEELFIEDIDSFAKARDINPRQAKRLLPMRVSGDQVRTHLEEIIGEPFHQPDQGEEWRDIFTSHVKVGGDRLAAAFLLKGVTTKGRLTTKKCGRNGEQIGKLVEVPASLYFIQHLDQIENRVIRDLKDKIQSMNNGGDNCRMCIIDGMDSARIFVAYGKIQP